MISAEKFLRFATSRESVPEIMSFVNARGDASHRCSRRFRGPLIILPREL